MYQPPTPAARPRSPVSPAPRPTGAGSCLLWACLLGAGACGGAERLPEVAEAIADAGTPGFVVPADTVPVADLHVHVRSAASAAHLERLERELELGGGPSSSAEPAGAHTAEDALAALDVAGIPKALVLSNAYLFGMPDLEVADEAEQVRAENDYVAGEVARHADRLTGACSVNPFADYAFTEIRRCATVLGLPVLKLHLTNSNADLRDPAHVARLRAVFDSLAVHDMGAIVHVRTRAEDYGAEDARAFIDGVLAPVPGVPVHIAHMAGWGGYDTATDAALGEFITALEDGRLLPERAIWFGLGAVVFQPEAAGADTAMAGRVRSANELLASRIRELGPRRVVYATDWPSWPPVPDPTQGIAANVRLVRGALGISEEEWREVFANEGLLGR